ncbi:MAG: RNA-binding S4 domain-containing protein [Rubrivivax sp.]
MTDNFEPFILRGGFITLDALLKASGAASSGGDAKRLLLDGAVAVNGQPESRRGRKLRPGDRVACATHRLAIMAPPGEEGG